MPIMSLTNKTAGYKEASGDSWDTAKSWECLAYNSANIKVTLPWDETEYTLGKKYVLAKLVAGTAYSWSTDGMDDLITIYDYSHNQVAQSEIDQETWSGQILSYTPSATGLYYFTFEESMGYGETTVNMTGTVAPAVNPDAPLDYKDMDGLDDFGRVQRYQTTQDSLVDAADVPVAGLIACHPMTSELSILDDRAYVTYETSGDVYWETTSGGMPYRRVDGYQRLYIYTDFPRYESPFSQSIWFYAENIQDGVLYLFNCDKGNVYFDNASSGSQATTWGINVNGTSTAASTAMQRAIWHHVVIIADGSGGWKLYLDGSLDLSVSKKTTTSTSSFYNKTQIFMRGNLGPIRIYDRALTPGEISKLYHQYD